MPSPPEPALAGLRDCSKRVRGAKREPSIPGARAAVPQDVSGRYKGERVDYVRLCQREAEEGAPAVASKQPAAAAAEAPAGDAAMADAPPAAPGPEPAAE